MSWDYSEVIMTDAGPVHSGRRRAMHTYLKQFGSKVQRIEDLTSTAIDDLIEK